MSRASGYDYQFVNTDVPAIINALTASYERISGRTVHPASPEKLFIVWVADVIYQMYANINYAGNQNIPSRAEGLNLDALGELYFARKRPEARAASVKMRFTISEAQSTSILIPAGTRVTNISGTPIYATTEDAYIAIGDITVDVDCVCQTVGTAGNGYAAGQIDTLVDVFPYFDHCANIEETAGGAEEATDDEYYEYLVSSENAYSCAGARGAYIYWAKSVSKSIVDVVVNTPASGQVSIYVLMDDGTIAGSAVKELVLEACNADSVRPLTDYVVVDDADTVSCDITATYYLPRDSALSAAELEAAIEAAVDKYALWQAGKFGRDINPSKLIAMMVQAGAKRVVLTSPTYTALSDGSDNDTPEIAAIGTITLTNGGYEDE